MKLLKCLYTSQKSKKRKSWNDGILKLNMVQKSCSLFALPALGVVSIKSDMGNVLDTKFFNNIGDFNNVANLLLTSLELENYLISEIEEFVDNHIASDAVIVNNPSNSRIIPNLNKKFKVPSAIVPKPCTVNDDTLCAKPILTVPVGNDNIRSKMSNDSECTYKTYKIQQNDIDSIWNDLELENKGVSTAFTTSIDSCTENIYDLDSYHTGHSVSTMNPTSSSSCSSSYYSNNNAVTITTTVVSKSSQWESNNNNNNNNEVDDFAGISFEVANI